MHNELNKKVGIADSVIKKVLFAVKSHNMIKKGDKIVAALSGGADKIGRAHV